MSSFIFILCTEELVTLLNHAENQKKIMGRHLSRASLPMSHLLFAEYKLFLCKVEPCKYDEVMRAVKVYGKASG